MSSPREPKLQWRLLDALRGRLVSRGFDLCAGLRLDQPALREHGVTFPLSLAGFEAPLGAVVGNTRALWSHVAARIQQANPTDFPNSVLGQDPIDEYVSEQLPLAVAAALTSCGLSQEHRIFYSHRTDYPSAADDGEGSAARGAVPIQRLAALSGLAALSPSHLSVHPEYGPWIALRAVVVLPLETTTEPGLRRAPCAGCQAPCVPALEQALAAPRGGPEPISHHWIAVRDACPVGRQHRYSDAQLRYHYSVLDRRTAKAR